MTTHRVWSAAAGTRDGLTWDTAWARIQDAFAVLAAGDTVLVHNTHSADLTGLTSTASPGTLALPCYVLCVDKNNSDALSTGALEYIGATYTYWGNAYYYGMTLQAGTGASTQHLQLQTENDQRCVFENCIFKIDSTSASIFIALGKTNSKGVLELRNCIFRLKNASQHFRIYGPAVMYNCSFSDASAGVFPSTSLFASQVNCEEVTLNGVDFSPLSSSFSFGSALYSKVTLSNCKMPVGWTSPTGTITLPPGVVSCANCWEGAENWHHANLSYYGVMTSNGAVYLTGGASDGVTPYSWKMVSSSIVAKYSPFDSPSILHWNSGTGSAQTVSIAIAADSATALTEGAVHLVAEYLGSATTPAGSFLSDAAGATGSFPFGNPTSATTTAQTTDGVSSWTGTGGWSNAKFQTLSVSITPQLVGWHRLRVRCATPSLTFYINPSAAVT